MSNTPSSRIWSEDEKNELRRRFGLNADGELIFKIDSSNKCHKAGDKVKGSLTKGGYLTTNVIMPCLGKKKKYLIHRVVYFLHTGESPDTIIDHDDRDKLNNHPSNLRIATLSQNTSNSSPEGWSTTGYRGVYKDRNKFKASITVNGKYIYLGSYEAIDDASIAYKQASLHYFKEFSPYFNTSVPTKKPTRIDGSAKSGFKGVRKNGKRFVSNIRFNTKQIYLGSFDTPEEAHEAYKQKHIEFYGSDSEYFVA